MSTTTSPSLTLTLPDTVAVRKALEYIAAECEREEAYWRREGFGKTERSMAKAYWEIGAAIALAIGEGQ